ncbi:hypothetical protein ACGFX4_23950 [Kitasatospora sp. NPDC048365]|uniref:hypothetical protein n=1 Tax=Kitasatospora sp. NPDC048365 TaxID=3364050 RepID=UPI00371E6742
MASSWVHSSVLLCLLAATYLPPRLIRGLGPGSVAVYTLAMNAFFLWELSKGPGWALPAGIAVSVLCAGVGRRYDASRIGRLDPPGLRALVAAAAASDGAAWIGLSVLPTGVLMVTAADAFEASALRQYRVLPGAECRFCLVEEQLRALLGERPELLAEYRAGLGAGTSGHVMIRRPSGSEPWAGRLRERSAYRVPPRRVPCDTHDPVVGPR